jgi:hypothetical protein
MTLKYSIGMKSLSFSLMLFQLIMEKIPSVEDGRRLQSDGHYNRASQVQYCSVNIRSEPIILPRYFSPRKEASKWRPRNHVHGIPLLVCIYYSLYLYDPRRGGKALQILVSIRVGMIVHVYW